MTSSSTPDQTAGERVRVGTVAELESEGMRVVPAGQATVVVFWHGHRPYALDNRCPHLGFPLHRGTVRDGVVTCHWHHAKFDLAGGCTFDAFADDARAYPVAVEDGVVWLGVAPVPRDERKHHLRKLDEGLEHGLDLVLAKAVLGLDGQVGVDEVIARGARFGIRNRSSGWSDGLSILVALANLRPHLAPDDRGAALFHGLSRVARSTAGQPPNFDLAALETDVRDSGQLTGWFRRFCEVRADGAAERTLRSATAVGLRPHELVALIAAACTDHRFLDVGHALDFANKAFELLDRIGWEHADEVLPSLIPVITGGRRMEETSAWRHPVDLAGLVTEATEGLDLDARTTGRRERGVTDHCAPDASPLHTQGQARQHTSTENRRSPSPKRLEALAGSGGGWDGQGWEGLERLADLVLDGDPAEALTELARLIRHGVPVVELSAAVTYAAALRLVHFPTTNEQGDWDTVHHVFTYANAVDQMLRRAPTTAALLRGLLDAAAAVHLERFLNVPKRPVPRPSGQRRSPADLLGLFDRHGAVDEVGQITCDLLAAGRDTEVVRTLGHALVREDATFHCYQVLEAAVRQRGNLAGSPAADHLLIAAARFLAAQFPTVRSRARTWDVARRLHRGETLHDDADL